MKTRELESLEKRGVVGGTLKGLVLSAALLGALGSPMEGSAKTVSSMYEGAQVTEVTQSGTEVDEEKKTITLGEAIEGGKQSGLTKKQKKSKPGIEPDPEKGGDDGEKGGEDGGEKGGDGARIETHGFIQVGTSVVPDFAGIFSDKASGLMCIKVSDSQTGLGVSVIRLDDFSSDPAYPVSRATVIVPSFSKLIGEGGYIETGLECSYMDKLPGEKEHLPYVVGSYSTKSGWTIEGKYFHQFKEGPDMDAFRLGITKQITDALSVTGHGWYKSDYEKHFYGRVIVDVKLGGRFGAQMSCIYKDGKFTPTRGVMYKF